MFDHVIVGGGSAGSVVAARITERPDISVLLLEAGPPDRTREIAIPAAFSRLFHTEVDWDYHTVPQQALDGRELYWPRGRVLGGTSSMNAMMWVRGIPADYDAWAAAGNTGWSYEEVVGYFRRAEDAERPGGAHVGTGGAIRISEQRDPNPGTHLFVAACQRAGIPRNPNVNAGDNEGVDYAQATQASGRRMSAAAAYLHPASRRPNLTVETGARVIRVVIEQGRAVGVTYMKDGELRTVRVAGDVIVSGGAVNSPQILMLSGVGPADHLRSLGIDPVVDLPGVGSNLVDHLVCGSIVRTSRTDSLVSAESPVQVVKYLAARRGMLTSTVAEAHAFVRSDPSVEHPDIELIFAPVPFLDHGATPVPGHGYTVAAVVLQPRSSGTIRLASADPFDAPLIDPRYMTSDSDLGVMERGLERVAEVLATEPLASAVAGPIRPDPLPRTPEQRVAAIRSTSETLYHPAGTCAMGVGDGSVVDPELRVRGVAGLRVIDASVMPSLNRGHTHAPAVMIGEKGSDLVLAG